jgi:hypothetical protein
MADLRGTIDLIKKRKKAIDDAAGEPVPGNINTSPGTAPAEPDMTDPAQRSAYLEAEYQKRKAAGAFKKKGWLW